MPVILAGHADRKSTRLNSSHSQISYAVFCLKNIYEEHGERCVDALRGMFAFAVWDERRRTLLLARDRLGKKPLYYAAIPGRGLVFASELKAVLEDERVERTVDLEALYAYLSLLSIPGDASIFRQVRKLQAGHLLVCNPGGIAVKRYWDIPIPAAASDAGAAVPPAVDQFRARLKEAVGIPLRSDVPGGAFLSGGGGARAGVAALPGLVGRPVRHA